MKNILKITLISLMAVLLLAGNFYYIFAYTPKDKINYNNLKKEINKNLEEIEVGDISISEYIDDKEKKDKLKNKLKKVTNDKPFNSLVLEILEEKVQEKKEEIRKRRIRQQDRNNENENEEEKKKEPKKQKNKINIPKPNLKLLGIIGSTGELKAIIKRKNKIHNVKIGDKIRNIKIINISREKIAVEYKQEFFEYK